MLLVDGSFVVKTPYDINKTLRLNLLDSHESAYFHSLYGGKKAIDHFVAEKFIRAGDTVVDVGANIGFCSLVYLMYGASKVFAFEPHPEIFNRLNSLADDNLITFELALGDTIGIADLITSSSHNQGHTINPTFMKVFPAVFNNTSTVYSIKTSTLDAVLGNETINFLKVDVEGSEAPFLIGANTILSNKTPRILHIEIYPIVFDEVMKLLTPHYRYIRRCVINTRTQAVKLLDITDPRISAKDINPNPPTYICTNDIEVINLT